MNPQDIAPPPAPRRRPGPWRWLVFALFALAGAVWLALDLLPRLAGGLLGRDLEIPGGGPGVNWDEVQVVWDSSPPAAEDGARAEESNPVPEPEPLPAERVIETENGGTDPETPDPAIPGGQPPPAGETGDRNPGLAKPGEGDPAGEGRRSPRILYSEWPSQELLADLDSSGSLNFRLRVERDGRVSEWEHLDEGGFDCRPCLLEAERIIASLLFSPGTLGDKAVACWVPYRISFNTKTRER